VGSRHETSMWGNKGGGAYGGEEGVPTTKPSPWAKESTVKKGKDGSRCKNACDGRVKNCLDARQGGKGWQGNHVTEKGKGGGDTLGKVLKRKRHWKKKGC